MSVMSAAVGGLAKLSASADTAAREIANAALSSVSTKCRVAALIGMRAVRSARFFLRMHVFPFINEALLKA